MPAPIHPTLARLLREAVDLSHAVLAAHGLTANAFLAGLDFATDDEWTICDRRRPLRALLKPVGLDATEVVAALVSLNARGLTHRLRRALGARTPRSERPRCGARTRAGGTCQARAVWDDELDRPRTRRGRCRMHGGLSTGPRTEAGKAAALAALAQATTARRRHRCEPECRAA